MSSSAFSQKIDNALSERVEGVREEIDLLKGGSLVDKVNFVRSTPGLTASDELDIFAQEMQQKKVQHKAPKPGLPKKAVFMAMAGLLVGGILGAGLMSLASPVSSTPAPVSNSGPQWNSLEEQNLYYQLSQTNGGLQVKAHCEGPGKVMVGPEGQQKVACLLWPIR